MQESTFCLVGTKSDRINIGHIGSLDSHYYPVDERLVIEIAYYIYGLAVLYGTGNIFFASNSCMASQAIVR